ncbi:MAG: hypothetical protein L0Z62_11185 [Gemmataceae bacterium]|nr:hypothetical protein [Gemmataceae bacterium]
MIRLLLRVVRRLRRLFRPRPPAHARAEAQRDRRGLPEIDLPLEHAINEAAAWLGRAQDCSPTHDGGVAHSYSLLSGWTSSYPETTGYIVPTLLTYARFRGGPKGEEARARARRMLDWLVSIQFPEGAFQCGRVDFTPRVPVTFNTGQILLGLAAGVAEFGDVYLPPMRRAADWLVRTQDPDGCWRRHSTPEAAAGEKAYETHVAWGLLEAARVDSPRYADAALANVRWSLTKQRPNGWFADCCLLWNDRPLTHTLAYALRGVVEAYRYSGDPDLLHAACKTADGLLGALWPDGFLPGQLDECWRAAADFACLTGSAQTAHCWLLLYQATGDTRYRDAAYRANRYVRRTVRVDGQPETRGAIKGSFPVDGAYGQFEYLNWACKFFLDSQLLELEVRQSERTIAAACAAF